MRVDRLRYLRESNGITQADLAEQLDETTLQIWRWENGKSTPDGHAIAKIARHFNISSDYLLGLSDELLPDMNQSDLQPRERAVIAALRAGDELGAIKAIIKAGK